MRDFCDIQLVTCYVMGIFDLLSIVTTWVLIKTWNRKWNKK